MGNKVTCVDKDARKIARLGDGILPIYDPGFDTLLMRNQAAGNLAFTTDLAAPVRDADIVFITVGTPARAGQGDAELSIRLWPRHARSRRF